MIAPVIGGSGVRMKILESLSSGMPTVTTTDGAAGLNVKHGSELLIADRPEDFAQAVISVLQQPELRSNLRCSGSAFLEAHHSKAACMAKVRQALERRDGLANRTVVSTNGD